MGQDYLATKATRCPLGCTPNASRVMQCMTSDVYLVMIASRSRKDNTKVSNQPHATPSIQALGLWTAKCDKAPSCSRVLSRTQQAFEFSIWGYMLCSVMKNNPHISSQCQLPLLYSLVLLFLFCPCHALFAALQPSSFLCKFNHSPDHIDV